MDAPVVLVICADFRRLGRVLDYLGYDHCLRHGYGYSVKLMSIMDACFMAENMVMAVECLGLGSVFVGSALANDEVIKVLKLPKGVLPLTLLCIGYPAEQPPTRPRWSLSSILHIDHYTDLFESEVEAFLKHMNNELQKEGYYQKYGNQKNTRRKSTYNYSKHIRQKTALKSMKEHDAEIIPVMKKTAFFPSKEI